MPSGDKQVAKPDPLDKDQTGLQSKPNYADFAVRLQDEEAVTTPARGRAKAADKPASLPPAVKPGEALDLAREEIEAHQKRDASRSSLSRVVGLVSSSDERSLSALKKLASDYEKAVQAGDRSSAERLEKELRQKVESDQKAVERKDDICRYGTGFLKTAGMFMRGKGGLLGTAAAYAADQINPDDTASVMAFDGLLGAGKGVALKGLFGKLGEAPLGIAARGVALGVGTRVTDLALTRQTWLDEQGNFSGWSALKTIQRASLSWESATADAAVSVLAHGMVKGGGAITGSALRRSPLASTLMTASSFGLISGSNAEVQRQMAMGRAWTDIDWIQVGKSGLIQGSLDTIAGVPGGVQASAAALPSLQALRLAGEKPSYARRLAADTQSWELGPSGVSREFFSRLGKALAPESGVSETENLSLFLKEKGQILPGVQRFAEAHPDPKVRELLIDLTGVRRSGSVGSSPYAFLSRDQAAHPSGMPAVSDQANAHPADLAAITGSRPAERERATYENAFGTEARGKGRKIEALWAAERDISKLTIEQRADLSKFVQTDLVRSGNLDALSGGILKVTAGWGSGPLPELERLNNSLAVYQEADRVVGKMVKDGDLPMESYYLAERSREHLAGRPDLLKAYDQYTAARRERAEANWQLGKALEKRAADLERAANDFMDSRNLPRVKLLLYDDLGAAGASYKAGHGQIKLRKVDLMHAGDTANLVEKLTHELTHCEQDALMVRSAIDHVEKAGNISITGKPDPAVAREIGQFYELKAEKNLDDQFLSEVISKRNGQRLTESQAARADKMFEAFRINQPLLPSYVESGNHFRMTRRELIELLSPGDPNTAYKLIDRLRPGHPGAAALSQHLFGSVERPKSVKALIKVLDRFEADTTGEVVWPSKLARLELVEVLESRLKEINRERKRAHDAYMAGAHEKEAWAVGQVAFHRAKQLGGTAGGEPPKLLDLSRQGSK